MSLKLLPLFIVLVANAIAQEMPRFAGPERYFPQVVIGGGWSTTLIFMPSNGCHANSLDSGCLQACVLQLIADDGNPMLISGTDSAVLEFIPIAHQTLTLKLQDSRSTTRQGYAVVTPNHFGRAPSTTANGCDAIAIVRQTVLGRPDFEISGIFERAIRTTGRIPFDNTGGNSTALAIVNGSYGGSEFSVRLWDESGVAMGVAYINFQPREHKSFLLADVARQTIGKRGKIEFTHLPRGGLEYGSVVLPILFNGGGSFTGIPIL